MSELAKEIIPVTIEEELKQSYLDYAMSVIVGRALPDARDGLKPVHRRILFAMNELGNDWNKAYKKSARVVGDVIGKYHPHGDLAVYHSIVRMAQPFSLRYMLIDGQGNFGSMDDDPPAAMRYTEVRMQKFAHEMLADLDKETVDWHPNYDGTEQIPTVLPTKIPSLLVNGSSGIAVGMATNIAPHNLAEVIDACLALMANPQITIDELIKIIPGPDFPTNGIINGRAGIISAYRTGKGRILIRAKTHVEPMLGSANREQIIVDELPYQVIKSHLVEKINELARDKKIEGISAVRDESDKDGVRVVIDLKRGESADVVLNNLYSQTKMQVSFSINTVALVDGRPKLLNLKEILDIFVRHRREVVTRRTVFELRKARERGHILEGQAVALANIDEVILLIKASKNLAEAKEGLLSHGWQGSTVRDMIKRSGAEMCRPDDLPAEYGLQEDGLYYLSPAQAQAILELRLHRLTSLEQDKLLTEYQTILDLIAYLLQILGSPERLLEVICEELTKIKEEFGDVRRTEIRDDAGDFTKADLIAVEERVVTISHAGYAKTQPLEDYKAQRRGGVGKSAANIKEDDYIEHLLVASSHATLLLFSSLGKVYWLRTFDIPEATRNSRGRPLVNLLPLEEGEKITALLDVDLDRLQRQAISQNLVDDEDSDVADNTSVEEDATEEIVANPIEQKGEYVVMATSLGIIKKVNLLHFRRPNKRGLKAINLRDDDRLIAVAITDGSKDIMLFSDAGLSVRFKESLIRPIGRAGRGVIGMRLKEDQKIVSMLIPEDNAKILLASTEGFGKRTLLEDFPVKVGRGGLGVIAIKPSLRNGKLVGAIAVQDGEEIMLISDQGTLIRTRVDEISVIGRQAQGVRLIKLLKGESLVGVERVKDVPDEKDGNKSDAEFNQSSGTINVQSILDINNKEENNEE